MIVIGAGLAGLACARDLVADGTDVVVVEARARTGGRVEAQTLDDGRTVELGGELVGPTHRHYLALAAELDLELEPSYTAEQGVEAYDLIDGVVLGDDWLEERDQAASAHFHAELVRLAAGIDPADPWSERDAARLDQLSLGDLLRSLDATPGAYRLAQLQSLAAGSGSIERLSLLAELRAAAAAGGAPMHDAGAWESLRLVGGSSTLVAALTGGLGPRIRLAAPVTRIDIGATCTVELADGEQLSAEAVVCAVPVGPLREIELRGLSDERLRSLHNQRRLLASKAVLALDGPQWRSVGWNGLALSECGFGGFWVQGADALSSLLGPDQRCGSRRDAGGALHRGRSCRAPAHPRPRDAVGGPLAALGARAVLARLCVALGAGRPHARRPAARNTRAAVLRRGLRPLGRRLHGGSGRDRSRRGAGAARTGLLDLPLSSVRRIAG